jgi:hypothetical protein
LIDLDRQMRQILARMEMLAHGGVTNYAPTGAGSGADTKPPTGELHPPQEHWKRRWLLAIERDEETGQREATTVTRHRRDVLEKAQADLDSYLKRTEGLVVGETERELEARIVREGEGWNVEQVAQHCRCTVTFARKARLKAARSVETGKVPKDVPLDAGDEIQRVRRLKEEGYTERGIRMILKIGGGKLQRLLREAA